MATSPTIAPPIADAVPHAAPPDQASSRDRVAGRRFARAAAQRCRERARRAREAGRLRFGRRSVRTLSFGALLAWGAYWGSYALTSPSIGGEGFAYALVVGALVLAPFVMRFVGPMAVIAMGAFSAVQLAEPGAVLGYSAPLLASGAGLLWTAKRPKRV